MNPTSPEAPPTANSADTALPRLLARAAALQGQAIPIHRFSMRSLNESGLEISTLPAQLQVIEHWLATFPGGDAALIDTPDPADFPLLWCAADGQRQLLLRGQLTGGNFIAEDADGRQSQLEPAAAESGHFVLLKPEVREAGRAAELPEPDAPEARPTARAQFIRALLKRRSVFLEGALATVSVNTLGMVTALYSMQVYDRVVPNQGLSTLYVLTGGVMLAILLELLMKQVRTRMVERACNEVDMELSSVFFNQALRIRMDARPRTVGTFAAQIKHFESVRNFMTSATLFALADAPFALIFIAVIAVIAGPVALVPLAMLPLAVLASLAFRPTLAKLTEAHQEESNRKSGLLIEAVDGIESIKASGSEWKMLERWNALEGVTSGNQLKIRNLTAFSTHLTQTIQQVCYVFLVAVGAYAILEGKLTVGGLIACTIISGRALNPMSQLAGMIVQWQQVRYSLKGLDGIMAMPCDREPGQRLIVPEQCRGEIRLEQVQFAYGADGPPSLAAENLRIQPGERIAVVGPVGSGKSTLIKVLSGLFKPQKGRALLDGVDVMHLAPGFVTEHIGYLPQEVRLFAGTVRENLALGLPSPSDGQILESARLTGLQQTLERHPKGLGLPISEGGRGLSGGQRQLVGLTRLLLARPRVLLLDEPTASMDGQLEMLIAKNVILGNPADRALVVVTHKMSLLPHFTRIIVMDRGQIIADGPAAEILQKIAGRPAPTPPARPAASAAA